MVDIDRMTVELVKKGDTKAFRRLYDHYAPFVWRIAYRTMGNDNETTEEVVQETFVNIHRSIKKFVHASAPGTWIYRIAFNTANRMLAKQARIARRTVAFNEAVHGQGMRADGYDQWELIEKAMAALSPQDRFVLVAREVDGLSFDEIAQITGASAESLRIRMFRLREKLGVSKDVSPQLTEVAQ
ncbi:MAG: RNA polymerase sigma factor [Chitinispirillaceae bacterium]|nr:RNA polymerase sigma factor [Chitinispirillaceae bacterium]